MTCRHSAGDPNCSSNNPYKYSTPEPVTPDATKYDVLDVAEISDYLILKVKYPNCSRCAFEGTKIMVFEKMTVLKAFKWKKIDPHFRDPKKTHFNEREAPSPIARFPGNDIGWTHAQKFVRMLLTPEKREERTDW